MGIGECRTLRVLTIDGGGVMGVIPAETLAALERLGGKPVASMFDLIVGTSVGGLLAMMLTKPDAQGAAAHSAAEVADLLQRHARAMFVKRPLRRSACAALVAGARYKSEAVDQALADRFGETPMHAAITPVVVTAFDLLSSGLVTLRSDRSGPVDSTVVRMREAARIAVAAPTYFDPVIVRSGVGGGEVSCLIDGGVCANHPGLVALAEARRLGAERVLMVSLGCGRKRTEYAADRVASWSRARWICPLLGIMTDVAVVDGHLRALAGEGLRYVRLDPDLTHCRGVSAAFDDCHTKRLRASRDAGRAFAEERRADLEALVAELAR